MDTIDRRELLKKAMSLGLATAGLGLAGSFNATDVSAQAKKQATIAVAGSGSNVQKVIKAVNGVGGIGKYVRKGAHVVIKPNAAWARRPDQCANVNPEVLTALIALCKKAGAGSITVYEHTCDNSSVAFRENGIQSACDRMGVRLIPADSDRLYTRVSIPRGRTLKSAMIMKPLLNADCFINVPVVKVHSAGVVTISLKNLMGCVLDRGEFHNKGLHQCIADIATVLTPTLTVVDATGMLLTNGPRGPGKIKKEGKVFAGTDMVALDCYGAKLLGIEPAKVQHIVEASRLGIGLMESSRIKILNV